MLMPVTILMGDFGVALDVHQTLAPHAAPKRDSGGQKGAIARLLAVHAEGGVVRDVLHIIPSFHPLMQHVGARHRHMLTVVSRRISARRVRCHTANHTAVERDERRGHGPEGGRRECVEAHATRRRAAFSARFLLPIVRHVAAFGFECGSVLHLSRLFEPVERHSPLPLEEGVHERDHRHQYHTQHAYDREIEPIRGPQFELYPVVEEPRVSMREVHDEVNDVHGVRVIP